MELNPRVIRGSIDGWVGKKVTIGTTSNHYVTGMVQTVAGRSFHISVAGHLVVVPAHEVSVISEAPAFLAEYVK
jgi:hypothetical protein